MWYRSAYPRSADLAARRARKVAIDRGIGAMPPPWIERAPSPTAFVSKVILGAIAVVMAGVVAAASPDWVAALLTMVAVAAALVAATTRWEVGQATPDEREDLRGDPRPWTSAGRGDGWLAVDEGGARRAAAAAWGPRRASTGAAVRRRPDRPTRVQLSASARPIPPALERSDASASRGVGTTPGRFGARLRITATGFVLAIVLALGALLLAPVAAAVVISATLIAVAVGGAVLLVERLTRPDFRARGRPPAPACDRDQ